MTRRLPSWRRALGGLLGLALGAGLLLVPTAAGAAVDPTTYVNQVAPLAQRETSQYGVPASVAIAQSVLETGWGGSVLATQANNYFGIKCPSSGDPAATGSPYVKGCFAKESWEYVNGTPVLVVSWFRSYATVQDSFLDHGFFLTTRAWYAPAFQYKDYPDQFIREVAKAGYATDPTYPDKVIDIMRRYNLYRFDPLADPSPTVADPGGFSAMSPLRVLDTRYTRRLQAGETVDLQFAGRIGIPSDAAAVALNITSTDTVADGFLTAYPSGTSRPSSSNLNPDPRRVVAAGAVVGLGANGSVSLYTASATHLVVDVMGYYARASVPAAPGSVLPLTPSRLADTRTTTPLGARRDLVVDVGTGASAVLLNLTVTSPKQPGYLTAYPSGVALPLASNVNFTASQTTSNAAWVAVGSDGKVRIHNGSDGTAHVVVDLMARSVGGGQVTIRGGFVPVTPRRVLDTRDGLGASGPVAGNGTLPLNLGGLGAAAVALNVTATDEPRAGFVTAYPSDRPRPIASMLNFVPYQVVPNLTQVRVGTNGVVNLGNGSSGPVHLVADLAGYYKP